MIQSASTQAPMRSQAHCKPTSAGSGSTPNMVRPNGVGPRRTGRMDYCCAADPGRGRVLDRLTAKRRAGADGRNSIFVTASRSHARASQRLRRAVSASIITLLARRHRRSRCVDQPVVHRGAVALVDGHAALCESARLASCAECRAGAGAQAWKCVQGMRTGLPGNDRRSRRLVHDGRPRAAIERPQHTVTISRPFAVSKYELTFADWDACVAAGGCNGYTPNDQRWGAGSSRSSTSTGTTRKLTWLGSPR